MLLFWEISGGLGNQLYQYSKSLEIKSKYKNSKIIYVYFRRFHFKDHEYPRLCEVLNIKIKIFRGTKIILLKILFSILLKKISKVFYYHNDNWWHSKQELENINFTKSKCAYISSLFQSLPNKTSLNFLRENFKFKPNSLEDYGVLHIRLGDYLNEKNKSEIGLVSNNYYREVYDKIIKKTKTVFIITNGDPNEVEKVLNIKKSNLKIINSKNDLDDFKLIMNSSHIGMPNSTFSIWAAYLSNSKNIYAPHTWVPALPDSFKRTKDLYYDNWIII